MAMESTTDLRTRPGVKVFGFSFGFFLRGSSAKGGRFRNSSEMGGPIHRSIDAIHEVQFLGTESKNTPQPVFFGTPKRQLWLCRKNCLGQFKKKNYGFLKVFCDRKTWLKSSDLNGL